MRPIEPRNSTSPTSAKRAIQLTNTRWPGVWPGQCSTPNTCSPTVTSSPSSSQRSGTTLRARHAVALPLPRQPLEQEAVALIRPLDRDDRSGLACLRQRRSSLSLSSAAPPAWSMWPWVRRIFSTRTPCRSIACEDALDLAAGIDHGAAPARLVPQEGAVLLERGHRDHGGLERHGSASDVAGSGAQPANGSHGRQAGRTSRDERRSDPRPISRQAALGRCRTGAARSNGGAVDGWSIRFVRPVEDRGHLLFEPAGNEEVQQRHPCVDAILEIVRHTSRNPDERALAEVEPLVADADARDPVQHVEDLVVGLVVVRAGTAVAWLHPPLGDGIAILRLGAVGFEHRAHQTHLVGPPLLRRKDDGTARQRGMHHRLSS